MSRYTAGEYAYGYDRPLQEYFIQKIVPNGDDFPELIELVGSMSNTYGNASNMMAAIEEYKIPIIQEHLDKIMMDLPF